MRRKRGVVLIGELGNVGDGLAEAHPDIAVARLGVERLRARVGDRLLERELRDHHELAVAVVFPAVIAADDVAVVDPALRQLGGAVAAAVLERGGQAVLVEEQHDLLAEQLERLRAVARARRSATVAYQKLRSIGCRVLSIGLPSGFRPPRNLRANAPRRRQPRPPALGRPQRGALGQQRAREMALARPLGGDDQREIDDVALRVAAADAPDVVAQRQDALDRLGVVAVARNPASPSISGRPTAAVTTALSPSPSRA